MIKEVIVCLVVIILLFCIFSSGCISANMTPQEYSGTIIEKRVTTDKYGGSHYHVIFRDDMSIVHDVQVPVNDYYAYVNGSYMGIKPGCGCSS